MPVGAPLPVPRRQALDSGLTRLVVKCHLYLSDSSSSESKLRREKHEHVESDTRQATAARCGGEAATSCVCDYPHGLPTPLLDACGWGANAARRLRILQDWARPRTAAIRESRFGVRPTVHADERLSFPRHNEKMHE